MVALLVIVRDSIFGWCAVGLLIGRVKPLTVVVVSVVVGHSHPCTCTGDEGQYKCECNDEAYCSHGTDTATHREEKTILVQKTKAAITRRGRSGESCEEDIVRINHVVSKRAELLRAGDGADVCRAPVDRRHKRD